jgi:hypothetical protein
MIFASSCKNEINLDPPDKAVAGNFKEIFEAFWRGMNQNYVFWDIDKDRVDWDRIYNEYKAKFSDLNINMADDLSLGYSYFAEITKNLSDGHFSITFNHPFLKDETIVAERKDGQEFTISDEQLFFHNPSSYFDQSSIIYEVEPNRNMRVLCATINQSALYFHCDKLFLTEAYQSNRPVRNLLDTLFERIRNQRTESIIIDLRNNSGGDVADLNFLLGRFVSSPHKFGYIKYKYGNNRLDHTPYIDAMILPVNNDYEFRKPIYILVDNHTGSMAEVFTLALMTFPNSMVVGTNTRGALGLLVNNNILYNGGSFKVAEFMDVNTSVASVSDLEFKNYERIGLSPDVHVEHDSNNIDKQLEYIIKHH